MSELKKQRDQHINRIFFLCLEMIFIFAVPAFIGAFAGLRLDEIYGTGRKITVFILFLTFVLSWIIVVFKYIKLNNKLKEMNRNIKKEENKI